MDLMTAPPVEFDTALAAKYGNLAVALNAADRAWSYLAHTAKEFTGRGYRDEMTSEEVVLTVENDALPLAAEPDPGYDDNAVWRRWYSAKKVAEASAKFDAASAQVAAVRGQISEFNAAFRARGGWTRAYLVTNVGGHVHSSMNCGTCYEDRYDRYGNFKPGTQYAWLPELSDHDEAEIITAAGSDACTVCYPNAPVHDLKRPRSVFSADERSAQEKRDEAAAKRDAKEAAKVTLTVLATSFRDKEVKPRQVTWKTVRALQNDTGALVRELTGTYAMVNGFDLDLMGWEGEAPHRVRVPINQEAAKHNLRLMVDALTERGIDAEALVAKNHKRAVKEGGRNWDGVLA